MNKYELAVVVSAKIEDEERAAVVDKCKALIERFGGTITNVDDWANKRLFGGGLFFTNIFQSC